MALTRIQLINLALDQSGLDSSYQTKARGWLNHATLKLAKNFNYKFYNKTAAAVPFVAGTVSYSLPTDFLNIDTINRVNSSGVLGDEIFVYESYEFDRYSLNIAGDPSCAMIDDEGGKAVFNTTPATTSSTSYRMRYFRKPTVYSTDNTDDAVVPDFKDQEVLLQELMKFAYENLDDERFPQKVGEALKANQALQRNEVRTSDTGKVQLSNANFVARRRR